MKAPLNSRLAIAPKETAQQLIETCKLRIIKAIESGWEARNRVQDASPMDFKGLGDGTISTMVYDWIATALEQEFKDDAPTICVKREYRSIRLIIEGKTHPLKVRFNKANAQGRVSPNKTRVATRFYNQELEQAVLPGIPHPTNIVICWQLNAAATDISSIFVFCSINANDRAWEFVIKGPTEVESAPHFSTTIEPTGKTSRVTSKGRLSREQEPEQEAN